MSLIKLKPVDLDDVEVRRQVDEVGDHLALVLHLDDVAIAAAQVLLHQTLGRLFRHLF